MFTYYVYVYIYTRISSFFLSLCKYFVYTFQETNYTCSTAVLTGNILSFCRKMWIAPKRSRTLSCGHVDSAHELSHVDTWTALTHSLMWICGQRSRTVSFGCGTRTTVHELSPVAIHADMWIPRTNSLIWMWMGNDCSWTLCRGYVDIWIALTNSIMSCVAVCCSVLQCVAVCCSVCCGMLRISAVCWTSLLSSWSMLWITVAGPYLE